MSHDLTFTTQISVDSSTGLQLRGVPLKTLIVQSDFISVLFFSLTGRQPTIDEGKLLNALLVAAFDSGLESASGFVPRVVISSGGDINSALASSILALGPQHGGAVTAAMELFTHIITQGGDIELNCRRKVNTYLSKKMRLPGYGNPKKKQSDERAATLFSLARRSRLPMQSLDVALNIETALEEQSGKKLPLNVDGAMAAVLVSMGIEPLAGNALYAVARVAGTIAHCMEEVHQKVGVRRLRADQIEYSA